MFNLDREAELPVVLLIDDDLVSREVVATVLTMSGYTVHTGENGTAALELLKNSQCNPGVILVDVQMPGLSGKKLIDKLREHSKALILAISASKPAAALVAAADGFLLKPFGAGDLLKLLNQQAARDAAPESCAPQPAGSVQPIINPETLAQLRDMMPETGVRQIYSSIVTDLDLRMKALEAAMARGDDAEVRRIGHAIKGGCAMAGALGAARLGELIEAGMLDRGGDQLGNSTRLLGDLRAAALNLERMLEAEFPA